MRAYGVNYDTGFRTAGTTTHEPFDLDIVGREMQIIRSEVRCDAVRITGADADRLEAAARLAAEVAAGSLSVSASRARGRLAPTV